MSRKIEKLLHLVAEMRAFDNTNSTGQKHIIQFSPAELSESDLDLVAAAACEENTFYSSDKEKQ